MTEHQCYICEQPAIAEATPTIGRHQWSIPLCLDHSAAGLSLLRRMFATDHESESWITVTSTLSDSAT